MGTTEDRIARIHDRAKELKDERRQRIIRIEAAVSAVLSLLLIMTIGLASRGTGGTSVDAVSDAGYAGAAMLGPEAGGYIVTALVAFMLGAVVTALIRSYRDRNRH